MNELERLKKEACPQFRSLAVIIWEAGVQAAYDAGWRPVPSEKELGRFLFGHGVDVRELRQWLLERGE